MSQECAMSRCLVLALVIVFAIAACSSDEPQELGVLFEGSFHSGTSERTWSASGPAVDEGMICAEATGAGETRFETPDGEDLTAAEVGVANDRTDPFSYVSIGEFICVDGSGGFTTRTLTEATNPAAFESAGTWELVGGEGYEDITGEGTLDEVSFEGQPVVITGTSSGVLRQS